MRNQTIVGRLANPSVATGRPASRVARARVPRAHVARALWTLAVASVVLSAPNLARAHEFYASRIPNQALIANSIGVERPCISCHNNPDGGAGCEESGGSRPCLNPFGTQFRDNAFAWDATLAAQDADLDGFTNGQELQEPTGDWRPGDPTPGVEAQVTRPGDGMSSPGATDADNDGYCWFGQDLDDNGDCLGDGENNGALDCNDGDNAVHSGATELCTNVEDDNCDGLDTLSDPTCEDVVDRDGDGVCRMGRDRNGDRDCIDGDSETTDHVDCDDTRLTVSPLLRENCTDGIDNNCDGQADMADEQCRNDLDSDRDGFCPIGRNLNPGDGPGEDYDCLDAGELDEGFDCDDTNPAVNSAATEMCTDALDNDCDGDADFDDDECRGFFDEDGDGHCPSGADLNGDRDCIDEGEAEGRMDCNDSDPRISPSAPEGCTNTTDDDCDGDVSLADADCAGYLDTDGDRYCFVGFDMNRDGDCADADEEGGSSIDCDDTRPEVNPTAIEVCTNGLDDDCDGSVDSFDPGDPSPEDPSVRINSCRGYADIDADGWCEVGRDGNGDGDCSDEGEVDAAMGLSDASPTDPTIYPGAPENCIDGKDNDQNGVVDDPTVCVRTVDADGDGWCPIGRDVNMDGDCLDDELEENVARSDCNEADPTINPDNPELCQNGQDEDCDGDIDLLDTDCFRLLDRDGDGFCGEGIDDNRDGDCLDEAEDRFGIDCDDTDPDVGPRAVEVCDDGIDNDCDGATDVADSQCECDASGCDDGDPCTIDGCDENGCTHRADPACDDAGIADASVAPDAGTGGGDDGGCGCATPGQSGGSLLPLLLVILGLARRRRFTRGNEDAS